VRRLERRSLEEQVERLHLGRRPQRRPEVVSSELEERCVDHVGLDVEVLVEPIRLELQLGRIVHALRSRHVETVSAVGGVAAAHPAAEAVAVERRHRAGR